MQYLNLYYFMYLSITIIICFSFYYIFKDKSKKTQSIALFSLLIIGVLIHFLKLLIPEYRNNLPNSLINVLP